LVGASAAKLTAAGARQTLGQVPLDIKKMEATILEKTSEIN
jgi:hypothetical protein